MMPARMRSSPTPSVRSETKRSASSVSESASTHAGRNRCQYRPVPATIRTPLASDARRSAGRSGWSPRVVCSTIVAPPAARYLASSSAATASSSRTPAEFREGSYMSMKTCSWTRVTPRSDGATGPVTVSITGWVEGVRFIVPSVSGPGGSVRPSWGACERPLARALTPLRRHGYAHRQGCQETFS